MEFKAELKGKEIVVKPIVETDGKNVKIIVPSFKIIKQLKRSFDGKRDIQPI